MTSSSLLAGKFSDFEIRIVSGDLVWSLEVGERAPCPQAGEGLRCTQWLAVE
jgi:hypothetical protein